MTANKPGKSPDIEDYLVRLKRKLRFMPKRNKENIIAEVRSHLFESAKDLGGLEKKNVDMAVANYGEPKRIARNYKQIYGYGKFVSIVFICISLILGVFTVPLLVPALNKKLAMLNSLCLIGSTTLLVLLFILIIFIGVRFGKWAGLFAGLAALASRGLTVLILTGALSKQQENLEVTALEGPCFLMAVVSFMLPLAGFVAGRTFTRYMKKNGEIDWD